MQGSYYLGGKWSRMNGASTWKEDCNNKRRDVVFGECCFVG
jgi:hypothetical protein